MPFSRRKVEGGGRKDQGEEMWCYKGIGWTVLAILLGFLLTQILCEEGPPEWWISWVTGNESRRSWPHVIWILYWKGDYRAIWILVKELFH